jgi:HEPN domain-containing protein
MTARVRTREVDKGFYNGYLIKAGEFIQSAENSFVQNKFNSAAVNAIHAAISSVDAWCVFTLSKRFAGEKHEDVVNLIKIIPSAGREDIDETCHNILTVLKMKNMAEYEERLVKMKEAERAIDQAKKIMEIVKKYLPS